MTDTLHRPAVCDLKPFIRDVPDWPKPGIIFKDITPLLGHPSALALAVEQMVNPFRGRGVDVVAGAESRGFIFGTALAQSLSAGFVPIRKPNKLPRTTHAVTYDLEYGTDSLHVHTDAIRPGQRVLLADDLLATGGTMKACCDLVRKMGGEIVGITFLIELTFLDGRRRLAESDHLIHAAIQY
jgi:adenine phosphoribosyltransferase